MAQTIIEFLAAAAERFGERPAVMFKPGIRYQKWSYAELWESSGRVASLLRERGVQKGDRALLWGPNCPQWVVSFFGCIRAGVIAVPLDLRSPDDFVEKVISKSKPSLAFVSRLTPGGGEALDLPLVRFEDLARLGKALVIVSSDLDELMTLCDSIVALAEGQVVKRFERGAWSRRGLMAAAFGDSSSQVAPA